MGKWRSIRLGDESSRRAKLGADVVLAAMRGGRRLTGRYGTGQAPDLGTVHYVCKPHRFILTTIPKVGSKSFRNVFLTDPRFVGIVETMDCSLQELRATGDGTSLFHFSFVRNPWDRVVSCYRDKIFACDAVGKLALISRFRGLRPRMPFDEFVEWLCSPDGSDGSADRHWISQHLLLAGKAGTIDLDFVGKLEHFDEDMLRVSQAIPLASPIKLPVLNRSASAGDAYRSYYTETSRKRVRDRYAADIDVFGYVF
jgi:hypothetical protein